MSATLKTEGPPLTPKCYPESRLGEPSANLTFSRKHGKITIEHENLMIDSDTRSPPYTEDTPGISLGKPGANITISHIHGKTLFFSSHIEMIMNESIFSGVSIE